MQLQLGFTFEPLVRLPLDVDYTSTRRPMKEHLLEEEIVFWHGEFGYNKHNTCIAGLLYPFTYYSSKIFIEVTICKAANGWTYGCLYGTRFCHEGASGGAHGRWYDQRDQYATQRDAAVSGCYDMLRWINGDLKHAPSSAKAQYHAAQHALNLFIAKEIEPQNLLTQ